MSLSSLVGRIVPAAASFVFSGGNPVAAFTGAVQADQARNAAKKERMRQAKLQEQYMEQFGTFGTSSFRDPYASQLVVNKGLNDGSNSGFFDTIRGGLREVGGFTRDLFSSGLPALFGIKRPPSVAQQPALTTVTNIGAQESQGSGSIQAGMGAALPSIIGGTRSLLKSPLGQLGLGTAVGGAISLFGGDGKQMRITRKMKSQARMVLNLTGGNISAAADILNISDEMLVSILLKRFRNDGPVVTKAALRKTKQTVRRLKSMCDMYDSLRPAATRRRTPMKRASSTTLIKN